jgi:hypothetical protein
MYFINKYIINATTKAIHACNFLYLTFVKWSNCCYLH